MHSKSALRAVVYALHSAVLSVVQKPGTDDSIEPVSENEQCHLQYAVKDSTGKLISCNMTARLIVWYDL